MTGNDKSLIMLHATSTLGRILEQVPMLSFMRKILISLVALLCLAALSTYALWTAKRPSGHYLSDLRIQVDAVAGVPAQRGNLLGIQPELFPADYQSVQRLHLKLAGYLQQAREQGLLGSKTVVVLPEHIGTWLWAVGEKNELYQALHRRDAQQWLAASNPLRLLGGLVRAQGDDRFADAYLRMKASSMADQYQQLFGGLAKEFAVTLVAGSIILPNPSVVDGQLHVASGPLYNTSLVFGADGSTLGQPQLQHFTSHTTRRYVQPLGDVPFNVFDTPAGKLAVLIGTDSWHPASYARLQQQDVQLLAVPASVAGQGRWSSPWRGFRVSATPGDARLHPGEVSEAQAWLRLGDDSKAWASMTVFLRGHFWNQFYEGQSFARQNDRFGQVGDGRGARLINLWL
jgi:predicted amidohydrolase